MKSWRFWSFPWRLETLRSSAHLMPIQRRRKRRSFLPPCSSEEAEEEVEGNWFRGRKQRFDDGTDFLRENYLISLIQIRTRLDLVDTTDRAIGSWSPKERGCLVIANLTMTFPTFPTKIKLNSGRRRGRGPGRARLPLQMPSDGGLLRLRVRAVAPIQDWQRGGRADMHHRAAGK